MVCAFTRSAIIGLLVAFAATAFQYGPAVLGFGATAQQWWSVVGWTLAPIFAAAGCFRAASISSGNDIQAWRDFAIGCSLWAAGTVIWQASDATFPGFEDAGYIMASLFFMAGMFRYSLQKRAVN